MIDYYFKEDDIRKQIAQQNQTELNSLIDDLLVFDRQDSTDSGLDDSRKSSFEKQFYHFDLLGRCNNNQIPGLSLPNQSSTHIYQK